MIPNGNILLKRVPAQQLKFVSQHKLLMSVIANKKGMILSKKDKNDIILKCSKMLQVAFP